MNTSEYILASSNEGNIIVDINPPDILSLEPLVEVTLTYNSGESIVANFISNYVKKKESYYGFLINKKIITFKVVKIPSEYENAPFTFSVHDIKYAMCKTSIGNKVIFQK